MFLYKSSISKVVHTCFCKPYYFVLIACCFFSSLFSAGAMTHLYFAERFCEIQGIDDEKTKREFIIGNLFPDIRYLGELPRELTHLPVDDIRDILLHDTPFIAGMKFHHWIDIVREQFVVLTGIYEEIKPYTVEHQSIFLKFIEEEILADFYDGRKWSSCLDEIYEEESLFPLSSNIIFKWHTVIQYTMQFRPSWLLWGSSFFRKVLFGIPNTTLYDWSYLLPGLAKEKRFQQHMQQLTKTIIDEIRKASQE